jgi:hypothetical protein
MCDEADGMFNLNPRWWSEKQTLQHCFATLLIRNVSFRALREHPIKGKPLSSIEHLAFQTTQELREGR